MLSGIKMRRKLYLLFDQIFLDRINKNHIIPTLSKYEQFHRFITTEGTDIARSLSIEIEEDPILLRTHNTTGTYNIHNELPTSPKSLS